MNKNSWENFYLKTPLDKIPWQKSADDFLVKIIESGKIKTGMALDLGCGTGTKSIFLSKKGFRVTGVDISETAIMHAKNKAKEQNVNVDFYVGNVTNLNFLGDKKFNFILDWACFHCIQKENRELYISEILKHCDNNAKLVLRCFSNENKENEVVNDPAGNVYLSSSEDIHALFEKYFKILEENKAKSSAPPGVAPSNWFYEYLMEIK